MVPVMMIASKKPLLPKWHTWLRSVPIHKHLLQWLVNCGPKPKHNLHQKLGPPVHGCILHHHHRHRHHLPNRSVAVILHSHERRIGIYNGCCKNYCNWQESWQTAVLRQFLTCFPSGANIIKITHRSSNCYCYSCVQREHRYNYYSTLTGRYILTCTRWQSIRGGSRFHCIGKNESVPDTWEPRRMTSRDPSGRDIRTMEVLVVLQRNTRWNWTKKMEWATTILPTIFRDADCSLFFAFPRWLLPAFTRKEWTTLQLDRSIFFLWGSFANWNSPRWSQYGWPLWHVKSTCCIVPKQSRWLALLVSYDCASPGGCLERMEGLFRSQECCYNDWGRTERKSILFKGVQIFYTLWATYQMILWG